MRAADHYVYSDAKREGGMTSEAGNALSAALQQTSRSMAMPAPILTSLPHDEDAEEIARLRRELQTVCAELGHVRAENEHLRTKYAESDGEVERLTSANRDLSAELRDRSLPMTSHDNKCLRCPRLTDTYDRLQESYDDMKRDIRRLRSEGETKKMNLAEAREELEDERERSSRFERKLDRATRELAKRKQVVEEGDVKDNMFAVAQPSFTHTHVNGQFRTLPSIHPEPPRQFTPAPPPFPYHHPVHNRPIVRPRSTMMPLLVTPTTVSPPPSSVTSGNNRSTPSFDPPVDPRRRSTSTSQASSSMSAKKKRTA